MKRLIFLLLGGVAAAALNAAAAPVKRADLPAHPAWVLHFDCDALRQTFLGKYLVYQMDKPELYSNMIAFQSIFSFDLRTQLHGITVYADNVTPTNNVVIVYADFDPDHIIKLFQGSEAAKTITTDRGVIYSWIDATKKTGDNGPRKFAVVQPGRLITSMDKESVIAARSVIDGTAPNLASSKAFPELEAAGDATFLQIAADKMNFLGSEPNVALLKMSRHLKFQAGESQEQLSAVLSLDVGDENRARQMFFISQGLIAMLSLQPDCPKAAKLAGGLSVKQDHGALAVTLSVPSLDLIAAIKEHNTKKEKP